MASVVAEFFQITGVDVVPPTNMAELIPYLLTVFIGKVPGLFLFLLMHLDNQKTAVTRNITQISTLTVDWRRF